MSLAFERVDGCSYGSQLGISEDNYEYSVDTEIFCLGLHPTNLPVIRETKFILKRRS